MGADPTRERANLSYCMSVVFAAITSGHLGHLRMILAALGNVNEIFQR